MNRTSYCFIFIVLISCFSTARAQNIDIDLLKQINLDRNRSLDPTFKLITNSVTPLSIATPLFFVTHSLIKKDSTHKGKAVLVCTSLILAGTLSTALKYAVHRPRPFETYSFIDKETSGGSYSFPSGHTSAAFSLATSVSIAYPKWYVITPAYLWATAVGYSRMDLGVHYPSDVLAGAIIGSGSAFISYKLNRWLMNRKPLK
ncbi:MAG TPA: hypothetical protein DGG95_16700 [Cytophagales bacterium]|jgi:membrane-associated phospholipid phosphatase|nr:hypothetical protein [Cytophagales bacterium]